MRTRSSNNSAFNTSEPEHQRDARVLDPAAAAGRIATASSSKGRLQIARTQLAITSKQTEATIANIVANAAGQYWDAVRARDNIKVLQQTLDLAQKSYERDKLALDLGALASLDIYQSRDAGCAAKDRSGAGAVFLRGRARRAAAPDRRGPDAGVAGTGDCARRRSRASCPTAPRSCLMKRRTRLRCGSGPRWTSSQRRLAIDDLNARIARNLMLPHVDLTVQGQAAGLGGNQVAGSQSAGYYFAGGARRPSGQTLGQVFTFNSPGYGAGVQVTLPFRSSAAQAQLADALVTPDPRPLHGAPDPAADCAGCAAGDYFDRSCERHDRIRKAGAGSRAEKRGCRAAEVRTGNDHGVRSAGFADAACRRGELAAECLRGISGGVRQLPAGHVDAAGWIGHGC